MSVLHRIIAVCQFQGDRAGNNVRSLVTKSASGSCYIIWRGPVRVSRVSQFTATLQRSLHAKVLIAQSEANRSEVPAIGPPIQLSGQSLYLRLK